MKSIEIDSGGPVMPRSKSRATVRSLVSVGSSRWSHARRTHARLGQAVVEPRGGAVAEVGADRLMDRRQHLEQDEDRADQRERTGEPVAALHRADERAHRDGEDGGQHAAQHEHAPPGQRPAAVGLRQDREELPFVAFAQTVHLDLVSFRSA